MTVKTHARIVSALVALAASISLAQASSLSLRSSPMTSKFGSSVTLAATVTPSTATGRITFFDGSSILGYRQISAGTASFSTGLLSSGTHSLSASYSGDVANTPAASPAISQIVYPIEARSIWNNTSVGVPADPAASVTADFNGDGFADVAVVQAAANGTVTILLGHGNGTLTVNCGGSGQPICPAVGGNPNGIVAGDFNEDGNTDLAVANGDGSLSLLLGNGDGTFSPAVTVLSGNPSSFLSITTVDFNNDGKLDLAVTDSSHAYVLLGDGTGKFSQSTVYFGETMLVPIIQAADLNNDGIPDLVFLVIGPGGNSVEVLFGDGNGTLSSSAVFGVGNSANSLTVGDFNGDGSLDIAVSNNTQTGTISVLTNDGTGNFVLSGAYAAGPSPFNPLAVDVNGDGKLDLVVGNAGNSTFNILLGNGDGTFAAPTSYPLPHQAAAWLTIGEFNRDGRADLAISENGGASLDVFLGVGSASSIAANAPQSQATQVNTSFGSILQAVVTDSSGNRVPYTSVTFTAPSSGASANLSGPESSSGAGTTLTVITDGNGNATVSALANTIAGSYVVSASVAGVGITANFALTNTAGVAANITATHGTPQSAALNTPFAKALVANVTDQYQNPVPGTMVVFSVPASGATANLSSYNVSTDSNGVASTNASANGNVGAYQVRATIQGTETSVNFSLNNENGAAIALTSSKSSITYGNQVTLTATVTPASATGKVTFFDGANILGYAPLTAGPTSAIASMSTILLSTAPHSITAFYSGDTNYVSVTSPVLRAPAVASVTARTLVPGVSIPTGNAVASIVGDFNGDGIADLALIDTSAGSVAVLLGNGDGTFHGAVNYSLGPPLAGSGATAKNPVGIVATDLNGDGAADIAVANAGDGTVSIFLGKGDGTFNAVQSALRGQTVSLGQLSSLAVGDFNGDGVPDLVVTNSAQNYAQVMLGNGNGTFTLESATFATGSNPANVQVSDINGDGIADFLTANSGSNNVSVLLGKGDGTFAAALTYAVEVDPKQAVVADFNHDGKPDIAVVAYGSGDVDVLLGQGTGGFNAYTRYAVGSSPDSLAALDFNGDGNLDLAVVNNGDGTISILPGNADGTFGTQTIYNVAKGPQYLAVGDFNGDGRTDLAVNINGASQPFPSQVDILLGISSTPVISVANGTPQSTTVANPFAAALGTIVSDGSGNPIAGVPVTFSVPSASTSAGASLSSSTGITNSHGIASMFATANTVAGAYYASATATGVNGSAQFLLTNIAGPAMNLSASQTGTPQSAPVNTQFQLPLVARVLDAYGNPAPAVAVNFTVPLSGPTATLSANASITDSNGNASITPTANGIAGFYTVVAYIPGTELSTGFTLTNTQAKPSIQLASTRNQSTFGTRSVFAVSVSPAAASGKVTLYDGVNPVASQALTAGEATLATNKLSSGKHLLTAYYSGDSNYVPVRSSTIQQTVSPVPATTFFSAPNATVGVGPASITHGDFNGDGIDDLAVLNKSDATVSILLGKGDGTFTSSATLAAGVTPVAILSADLNADGVPDLAVADSYSNSLEVLLGRGDGTFAPVIASPTLSGLTSLAAGDFNGDGVTDLLAAVSYQGGAVQVLLGAGDGTFAQSSSIFIPGPLSVAVADFNNDGLADFAVAGNSNSVYVFLNSSGGEFGAAIPVPVQTGQTFVTAGDLNHDGNADLVLADTGSANLRIILGNGDGTFQTPATLSAGNSSPSYVQIADLNGDGTPDLAVGYLDGRSVGVLLGNGDGTFGATTIYSAGLLPSSLLVGDFNGDGRADLAVANQGSNTVSVLLGSGPATVIAATAGNGQSEPISTVFLTLLQVLVTDSSGNPVPGATVTFSTPLTGATAVLSAATALTNNAGLASVKPTSNTVAGTYSVTASAPGVPNAATFALTNTVGPVATLVSIAGTPQNAAFNTPFASALQVLVTDAGGNPVPGISVNFSAPASGASAVLSSATAITNSSGVAAVAATANAIAGGYNISSSVGGIATPVLFGLTNSPLAPSLTLLATPNPVNFGGKLSISALFNVTNPTGTVTFYDGTNILGSQRVSSGAATISTPLLSSGKHPIYASYSGDSNYPQAKSTAFNESINLVAASTLIAGTTQTVGTSPVSVAIGDFNQDGKDDMAVVNSGSGTVTVLLGNGDGTFARPVTYSVGINPSALAITDLNSDGIPDLIVANSASNSLSILLGNGDGTFAAPTTVTGNFTTPTSLAVADFNHDGKADVAVGTGSNSGVWILFGNGAGGFAPSTPLNVPTGSKSLVVGDFNGDGNADIAIANNLTGSILVVLGNGDGTFANPISYGAGLTPVSLTAADFNGDGNTDLAIANSGDNSVSILLGNGDGTFATALNVTVGSAPTSIAAVDLEGRGVIDLVVTNSGNNTISYLAGNGDGTFAAPVTYATGTQPVSTAPGDFNGDGRPDLAIANEAAGTVSTLVGAQPAGAVAITTTSLADGSIGNAYSTSVSAQGGTTPYSWSIASGALPTGLTLDAATGAITGTPSGPAGTSSFTVKLNDSSSPVQTTSKHLSITVAAAVSPSISTSSLANGVVGTAYSQTLAAKGGITPYSWTIATGALPSGLTLNATSGAITGTPGSPAGTSLFTVQVADSSSPVQTVTKQLGIIVTQASTGNVNPPLSLVLPSGTQQPGSSVTTAQVQAAQPATSAVTGTVTLNFDPNASGLPNPWVNPGVCFAASSCASPPQSSASFTLPTGSTTASIPAIQTGTVAGDVVLTLSVNGQPDTTSTLTIPRTAPVIEANSVQILDLNSSGFAVELVANSSPRDLQSATFTFNAANGTQISGSATFTVDLSSTLSQWYASSESQTYGSAFSLQVPFTLSGNPSAIQSVTVTLTNSAGTSAAVTGTP